MAQKILTESGTNEIEFLEFYLGTQSFAVNVAKILQIIPFKKEDVTSIVSVPDSVLGSLLWRNRTIDLIDLQLALKRADSVENDRSIVLVTNFNNATNGFKIDGVERIHRVSWKAIKPMDMSLNKYSPRFTGMVCVDKKIVLLVDFEKIVSDLIPGSYNDQNTEKQATKKKSRREDIRIVFAEDSNLIRNNINGYLNKAGYNVVSFENGLKAFEYVSGMVDQNRGLDSNENGFIDLLVTDIEMPQMDGLTLCKKVKEKDGLNDLPVLIFSSLINEQMISKCKEVDANAYVTKPGSEDLLAKIDELLLT